VRWDVLRSSFLIAASVIRHSRGAWSLPEHAHVTGISGVKRAVAIAQAADKSAARLFTKNIAIGEAPLAHRFLDNHGEAVRHAAEKMVSGVDYLVGRVLVCGLRRQRGRLALGAE
jgi:hypothetical protein